MQLVDPRSLSPSELIDRYEVLSEQVDFFQETIADLELAIEDQGWTRYGSGSLTALDFSRAGLGRLIRLARMMYLKNPLIRRAVDVTGFYTWAKGVNISSPNEIVNEILQAFLDDPANKAELTSIIALLDKDHELGTAANLFFVLFGDPVTGAVRVRTIAFEEVSDIITNPEDSAENWYYKREWDEQRFNLLKGAYDPAHRIAYYPDVRLPRERIAPGIGGKPVYRDQPVYHVKIGGLGKMKFGVPEIYSAMDWARAAVEDLEDYAIIRKSLAKFSHLMTIAAGGKKQTAAARKRLDTTVGGGGAISNAAETNPPGPAGQVFIAGEGVAFSPINTRMASPDPDGGRRLVLMMASGAGLPETFFGDADVGNHATAATLDRPTELRFLAHQKVWVEILLTITRYALDYMLKVGVEDLPAEQIEDRYGNLRWQLPDDPKTGKPEVLHIDVTFPDLLERSVTERIGAIVDAVTLKGHTVQPVLSPKLLSRLVLDALNEDDIDEILAKLYPEGEGEELAEPPAPPQLLGNPDDPAKPGDPPAGGRRPNLRALPGRQPTAVQAALVEGLRDLRRDLLRIAELNEVEDDEDEEEAVEE